MLFMNYGMREMLCILDKGDFNKVDVYLDVSGLMVFQFELLNRKLRGIEMEYKYLEYDV